MDIKDFILISGGILIALVVMHGFWIAWKSRREPYRLDIAPDILHGQVDDDIGLLRGELPNGGARVITHASHNSPREPDEELQESLAFESAPSFESAPTLMDAVPEPRRSQAQQAPPRPIVPQVEEDESEPQQNETSQAKVREVKLVSEPRRAKEGGTTRSAVYGRGRERKTDKEESRNQEPVAESRAADASNVTPMREILIVNLLAPKGLKYDGERLVNALRDQGLRYGEMNIFHKFESETRAKQFSVTNVVEPGTFDLSDLDHLHSPGMSFFLQLPGPEDALAALETLFDTAHNVALELGGELRDEQLSVLTGQTKEHMRQRIADFTRRRLSKRA